MLQRELTQAEVIAEVLSGNDVDAILGLCYGATYAWGAESRRAVAAMVLSSTADGRWAAEFIDPMARFLREIDEAEEKLDDAAERVIRAVLANRSLVEKLPTDLLAVIQPRATANLRLTYDITRILLDVGGSLLANPADIFFAHAGDLTTLALTLHRQPRFRREGLELF